MNLRTLFAFVFTMALTGPSQGQTHCLFNPSTGSHQLCHHLTAGGQCAHFGAACGSSGQGMYNPRTNSNQKCAHVTADGRCAHYGASSGKSGKCMFNRAAGANQACLHVTADGKCVHFGAPCN